MAFDAYLKIDGIPGESTDSKHKEWIEILSYSHGLSQPQIGSPSGGGGRSSGRADHAEFSVVKKLDKASPKLALYCCNGTHIKEITLDICRDTGERTTFMTYKLSDVLVSSYSPAGAGGDIPSETVAFNYGKINLKYTETDPGTGKAKGNVESEWDRTKNSGK